MKFPQNKAARIVLWCCIVVVTLIVLVGGWYVSGRLLTYEPTKAARTFVETIGNGDIAGAYEQTSNTFKEYTTLEQLEELTMEFPFMLSLANIRFTSWSMATGEPTKIGGMVTSTDGTRASIAIELTKEDGAWRVSYMEIQPS